MGTNDDVSDKIKNVFIACIWCWGKPKTKIVVICLNTVNFIVIHMKSKRTDAAKNSKLFHKTSPYMSSFICFTKFIISLAIRKSVCFVYDQVIYVGLVIRSFLSSSAPARQGGQ